MLMWRRMGVRGPALQAVICLALAAPGGAALALDGSRLVAGVAPTGQSNQTLLVTPVAARGVSGLLPQATRSQPSEPKGADPHPVLTEKHLPDAMFLGCEGAAGDRFCRMADHDLTLLIPLDSTLPQPFASFLTDLPPLTPVAVVVDMPAPGSGMPPRLISITRRDGGLAEDFWPQIQGQWLLPGPRPVRLELDGQVVQAEMGQRLLGGGKLWLSDRCGGHVDAQIYVEAYDPGPRGGICYELLSASPDKLRLMQVSLGDVLEFHRP